jgi:Fic family protein
MDSKFSHFELKLIEPSFGSELTDLIIDLDHLRRKRLGGSTPAGIFFQLKNLFHTLESIGSARIEGNNTTIVEYIETKIEESNPENIEEDIREILNVEKAMSFIDDNIKDYPINRAFISELHKMVVDGLNAEKEGDRNPGQYRTVPVKINKSSHIPPESFTVEGYMDELIEFINRPDSPKYDLLKVAIAHHRFVWIHPFCNGNGRTVRLFTYAMLVKQGFRVDAGRILNPTAVFCGNRDDYYQYLSKADTGQEEGLLEWCQYVLKGLKEEIEKIDRLCDYEHLKKEILYPTLDYSLERKFITDIEAKVLKRAIDKKVIQNSDLKDIFSGKITAEISRHIKKLTEKKMLSPEKEGTRKYIIRFNNNYLLRGIIHALGEKGFLPMKE